mgnify:CR=1 FL=1
MRQFEGFGIHNCEAQFQCVRWQCASIDRLRQQLVTLRSCNFCDAVMEPRMQTAEDDDAGIVCGQTAIFQLFSSSGAFGYDIAVGIYCPLPVLPIL